MADRSLIAKWRLDAEDATSVAQRGALVTGSCTVTMLSVTGIETGMLIQGRGIPWQTTVESIAGNVLTLSAPATCTREGGAFVFVPIGDSWTDAQIDWLRAQRTTYSAQMSTGDFAMTSGGFDGAIATGQRGLSNKDNHDAILGALRQLGATDIGAEGALISPQYSGILN